MKFDTHFSRGAIKVERGKVLKKNATIGSSWRAAKLFIMQKYTYNANEDVPLAVENA